MSLTETEIQKSKPREKPYRLPDGKGLFLFITPTGGKLWRFKYRHGGMQKLMALGKYPDVPLALARERHAEARRLLATSVDPMEQRKAKKNAEKAAVENSFQSVTARWLEHWQEWCHIPILTAIDRPVNLVCRRPCNPWWRHS